MVGVSKRLGCETCRQKRKKCDQQKPICLRCRSTGLLCEWTKDSRFRFVNESVRRGTPVDSGDGSIGNPTDNGKTHSGRSAIDWKFELPAELHWKAPKDPTQELGSAYSALVATFIELASVPCSMITSTTSDLRLPQDQDRSLSRSARVILEETLRRCSSSQPLIWTLLSALVCRYSYCDPNHEYDRALVVFIVGRALEALHADISKQGRLHAYHLQAMRYLCAAEIYRLDFLAAKVHLRAAQQMIDAHEVRNGQLQQLSNMFTRADIVAAACSLERPLFPTVFDPGPPDKTLPEVLCETMNTPVLQRMGSGLLRLPDTIIPPLLAELVEDIRLATCVVALDSRAIDFSTPTGYWLNARSDALHHRVWSIDAAGPMTKAIQLALICWVTTLQNPLSAAKLLAVPLQRTFIEDREMFQDQRFGKTLLWILFLGAMVSSGDLSGWYVDELSALMRSRNFERMSRASLTEVIRDYFLLEEVHRDAITATMHRLYRNEVEP